VIKNKKQMKTKILLIYTGGTIGMVRDSETKSLVPLNFKELTKQVPELNFFDYEIESFEFEKPIDSSNVNPDFWIDLVNIIEEKYHQYDGFVILHGTDTMAHTASALSFMIQNLHKPIILTGSQLPIGTIRTDGKENLITAIEIAASQKDELHEVAVCFSNKLYRGNRISKHNAEYFNAFTSDNYPPLAEIGINIRLKTNYILPKSRKETVFYKKLNNNIAILKIFPGMHPSYIKSILNIKNLQAVILETYGAGNAPTDNYFIKEIEKAIKKGINIINVTQCQAGAVHQGQYETSLSLKNLGVISAKDMTTEATLTKLMHLLGNGLDSDKIKQVFPQAISGEIYKK
jgi:L-asparaginase